MSKVASVSPREGGATFSLRNRIYRLAWGIVWRVAGSWTPIPMHRWRRVLLNAFGAQIHSSARIYPGVQVWSPRNLRMDAFSCLGPEAVCYSMTTITLGRYALVSQRAHLCAGSHNIDSADFELTVKPIVLEENSWVAAEAFVGPGVTVGHSAVIGARAVLFSDAQATGVYVGNPAKLIRRRRSCQEGRTI